MRSIYGGTVGSDLSLGRAALKHPNGAKWSNCRIAEHVGVDEKTVAKYRQKLTPEIPESTNTREGRDGRTTNTTNIGRRPAAPQVETDEDESEKVALGKSLEKIEREAAKKRQREHGGTAPGKKNTCGNFTQVSDKGRTRDKIGKAIGMSGAEVRSVARQDGKGKGRTPNKRKPVTRCYRFDRPWHQQDAIAPLAD